MLRKPYHFPYPSCIHSRQGFHLGLWPNLNPLLILSQVDIVLSGRSLCSLSLTVLVLSTVYYTPFLQQFVYNVHSQQYCIQYVILLSSNSFQFAIFPSSNNYQQSYLQSTILFSSNSFHFAILPSSNNFQQYCLHYIILLSSNSLQYAILPFSNTFPNFLYFFQIFPEFFLIFNEFIVFFE